jgi:hypothetical protein
LLRLLAPRSGLGLFTLSCGIDRRLNWYQAAGLCPDESDTVPVSTVNESGLASRTTYDSIWLRICKANL